MTCLLTFAHHRLFWQQGPLSRPFPVITSWSCPTEWIVFNKLKSENYVKYAVRASSLQAHVHLPAPSYDTKHRYIRKCSVEIRAERKHKSKEENLPFSSPVPRLGVVHEETDQLWQSKWKHWLHQEYLIWRILLLATAVGISCFYAQNSATLKEIKLSFWEVLTGLFQRCEHLLNNNHNRNTKVGDSKVSENRRSLILTVNIVNRFGYFYLSLPEIICCHVMVTSNF